MSVAAVWNLVYHNVVQAEQMLEDSVLKNTFGNTTKFVKGGGIKQQNEELNDVRSSPEIIEMNR
jgi:hypothetical protein